MLEKIGSFIAGVGLIIASWFGYTPEPEYVPITEVNTVEVGDSSSDEDTFGAFNPVGGQTYRLKTSIGTTDTTILLSSFKEPITGNNITMTSLNSDIGYATIDPQSSSRKEFVSFTGITQNSDGSATLTGVSRGLSFQYPFTASSTLRQSHPGQSILILSDSPQFFAEYARLRSDETITGYWSAPSPTSGSHLATRDYVLSAITGTSSIAFNKVIVQGTGGETFATGTILYLRPSDQRWYKLDVDSISHYQDQEIGVAQGPGTSGGSITNGVLTYGLDSTQVGMTGGNVIFAASTAGATTTATTAQAIGRAISATTMFFDKDIVRSTLYNVTLSGVNGIGETDILLAASSTFTGASLPQPVALKAGTTTATGTAVLADANDTNTLRFIGFAITSTTTGGNVSVRTQGIVDGFTGLIKGEEYWVQDDVGTIGRNRGMYGVLAGIAVSTTELLIEKGEQKTSGVTTFSASGSQNQFIGFRPRKITIYAAISTGAGITQDVSWGGWTENGGNNSIYFGEGASNESTAGNSATLAWRTGNAAGTTMHSGTISTTTDYGFVFTNTKAGSPNDLQVYWEAEG